MKNFGRVLCYVVFISLIFFFAGCEKKKVEQVSEITPPSSRAQESPLLPRAPRTT